MSTEPISLVPLSQRPLRERVAANVRAELARYGHNNQIVAAALGITPQAVSLKMRGKRPLTIDDLEVIAPLVFSTPEDLLAGARNNPRPDGPDGGGVVRPQGLEPRTRCFGASAGQGGAHVLTFPGALDAGEHELQEAC